MAHHRARLSLIASGCALLLSIGVSAQAAGTTTLTMQQVQGKNLLWLNGTMTSCPSGMKLVSVMTPTGPRPACIALTTTTTTPQ